MGVVSKYYPQRCLLRSDKSMATNTSTNTAISRCAGSTEALINAHQSENARTRAAQTGRSRGKMKMKEEQCGVSGSPVPVQLTVSLWQVRVVARFRPLSPAEIERGDAEKRPFRVQDSAVQDVQAYIARQCVAPTCGYLSAILTTLSTTPPVTLTTRLTIHYTSCPLPRAVPLASRNRAAGSLRWSQVRIR